MGIIFLSVWLYICPRVTKCLGAKIIFLLIGTKINGCSSEEYVYIKHLAGYCIKIAGFVSTKINSYFILLSSV